MITSKRVAQFVFQTTSRVYGAIDTLALKV